VEVMIGPPDFDGPPVVLEQSMGLEATRCLHQYEGWRFVSLYCGMSSVVLEGPALRDMANKLLHLAEWAEGGGTSKQRKRRRNS
jgi:hypothetical protein